jgi:hypothetical protein
VIRASDSKEAKGNLMKNAIVAIENNSYIIIFGIQIQKDYFG